MLCLAGAVGIPYNVTLLAILIGELMLIAVALTSFGMGVLMIAVAIIQFQKAE
jgi:hypothetical protein